MAGADRGRDHARRTALLAGWLRRTRATGHAERWVLRGSIVTAALCPDARSPADVDYVLAPTAVGFDPDRVAEVSAIAEAPPQRALVPFALASAAQALTERCDPANAHTARVDTMVSFGQTSLAELRRGNRLDALTVAPQFDRIMAYPEIAAPAYRLLARYDRTRLLPGVDSQFWTSTFAYLGRIDSANQLDVPQSRRKHEPQPPLLRLFIPLHGRHQGFHIESRHGGR